MKNNDDPGHRSSARRTKPQRSKPVALDEAAQREASVGRSDRVGSGRGQDVPVHAPRFQITIVRYCKRRIDPDNCYIKPILDGLVKAGVLEDDSYRMVEQPVIRQMLAKEAKTRIVVEQLDS